MLDDPETDATTALRWFGCYGDLIHSCTTGSLLYMG